MKYTWRLFSYGVYDYKNAELMLNNMAGKGYVFRTTGKGWFKSIAWFEKSGNASKTKFGVDVRCGLKESEKEEYYSFYKDTGWQNVDCYRNKLHIFVNTEDTNNEIYTEPNTEFENLKEAIKDDIPNVKKSLAIIAFFAIVFFIAKAGTATINRDLTYLFMVMLLIPIIFYMAQIVGNLVYKRQCVSLINKNEFIKENGIAKELQFYEIIGDVISVLGIWMGSGIIFGRELWIAYLVNGEQIDLLSFVYISSFICLCLSIPIIAVFTYMVFRKPDKDIYKVLTWLFGYFFYFGFITAIQQYSLNY